MDPECLREAYVRFQYLTPDAHKVEPLDQKQVLFTKFPESDILIGNDRDAEGRPLGIQLHCVSPYTFDEGGMLLLLQISGYIDWEIGFVSAKGFVREFHRVYFSLPLLHKIKGPHILINMWTPWRLPAQAIEVGALAGLAYSPAMIRGYHYAGIFYAALRKMDEFDELLKRISQTWVSIASKLEISWGTHIKTFITSLESYEVTLNRMLEEAYYKANHGRFSGEPGLAMRFKHQPDGSGRFPGSRLA